MKQNILWQKWMTQSIPTYRKRMNVFNCYLKQQNCYEMNSIFYKSLNSNFDMSKEGKEQNYLET